MHRDADHRNTGHGDGHLRPVALPAVRRRPVAAGFTIIELVVTLVVVGVLAVVVLPRFADRRAFDTRGFADQTRAAIELARKAAVAQRRNVCVAVAATSVTLTQATAPGPAAACTTPLTDPASGNALVLAAPAGISLAASAGLTFGALGEPLGAAAAVTVTVSGDGTHTLTVERGSGHVH